MPLPDERPRASVANLIGRFEQTQKRQSLTFTGGIGSHPTRSSSVTSQNTGDSAKEEVKEKREWPPPAKSATPPTSWRAQPAIADTKPFDPTPPKIETPKIEPAPVEPPPKVEPPKVEEPTPKTEPLPKKSTAKTPATPKFPTPIKQQHTGTQSGRRSVASATTPTRPKTPSRATTTTSSTTRPKTPSSVSRSKTPSRPPPSSYHTPVRARASEPPTPVKKTTLSPESADRLSKPTAASASKARDAADGPVKTTVKSAAQKAREAAAKSHAEKKGLTPKPVRKPLTSTLKKGAKKPAAATSTNGHGHHTSGGEEPDHAVLSHATTDTTFADEEHSALSDSMSQSFVEEHPQHHQSLPPPPASEPEPSPSPKAVLVATLETDAHPPTDEGVTLADPPVEKSSGDDIADMVNMLEGVSLSGTGPKDDIPIPVDDVREIPDEDDL